MDKTEENIHLAPLKHQWKHSPGNHTWGKMSDSLQTSLPWTPNPPRRTLDWSKPSKQRHPIHLGYKMRSPRCHIHGGPTQCSRHLRPHWAHMEIGLEHPTWRDIPSLSHLWLIDPAHPHWTQCGSDHIIMGMYGWTGQAEIRNRPPTGWNGLLRKISYLISNTCI